MERDYRQYTSRALIVAALALSAAFIYSYWPFTLDDSFITFRYAKNLAEGYWPVYNPGAEPAEGYTSFLWVLIMAVPHLMGMDAEIFSKIAGVAFFALTLLFGYRLVRQRLSLLPEGDSRLMASLFLILNAAFYAAASHVVSGMETLAYTALLTGFFYFLTSAMESDEKKHALLAALAGLLAGLTRPEGNLAVCVAFAAAIVFTRDSDRRRLIFKVAALFYALSYALYFAWRFYYYGHLFPLTFYVKVSGPALKGLPDVLSLSNYMGARLGVLLVAGVMAYGRALAPAALGALSLLVFFVFPDHSIQGFNYRFLYPLVPFIMALAAIGAGALIRLVDGAVSGRVRMIVTIGLCVVVPLVFLKGYSANQRMSIGLYEGATSAHLPLARKLAAYESARKPVLAISDAGVVPYYSGWTTIDIWSLNDEHIVMKGHDPEYVMSQSPDVLVLVSRSASELVPHDSWAPALYAEATKRGMYPVKILPFRKGRDGFYLWVLAWPATPLWDSLSAWDGK